MKLPSGEFWFEAPKNLVQAKEISDALKEAGILDSGLVTQHWAKAGEFSVEFNCADNLEVFWTSKAGLVRKPSTKVVFTLKAVVQLDCTIEEPPKWKSPKLGTKWQRMEGYEKGDIYILATPIEDKVCLINMSTGNRWKSPLKVEDEREITEREWTLITSGDDFQQV